MIFYKQIIRNSNERTWSINPRDFYFNEFYMNREEGKPLKLLIDTYEKVYDGRVTLDIFKDLKQFYYDYTDEIKALTKELILNILSKLEEDHW